MDGTDSMSSLSTGAEETSGASAAGSSSAGTSSSTVICNPKLASEFGYEEFFPNVQKLFNIVNTKVFDGLIPDCDVKYSRQLYGAVGFHDMSTEGVHCIRLSWPQLRLRPLCDTLDVLLHEAVHAYDDVLGVSDPIDHGNHFLASLEIVNKKTGIWIKDIMTFDTDDIKDDIQFSRCNGICKTWEPVFGIMRGDKPSNMPHHTELCGGTFDIKQHCGYSDVIPGFFFDESHFEKKEKMSSSTEELTCFVCEQTGIQRGNLRKHWNQCLKTFPSAEKDNFLLESMEGDVDESTESIKDPKEMKFACPLCLNCFYKDDLLKHLDY